MQGNLGQARNDSYVHDSQNRLVEASRSGILSGFSARYFYDDAGNRVSKTVDGVTTQFVLDGNQLLEEYDGQGNLLRRYVHAGLDEPVRMNTIAGAEFYYHQDALGSVVALSNASGFLVETYAYGPYGETGEASAVSNPFRYTGREFDAETGLYYYRARYYSADLGRFLEPDPIGFGDGMNVYAYVGNNPINFVDPLGLSKVGSGSISSLQPPGLIDSIAGFVGLEGPRGIISGFRAFFDSAAEHAAEVGLKGAPPVGFGLIAPGPLRGITSIRTPFGTALQEFTPEALALRGEVAAGRQVFRGGNFGRSTAAEGQFFAAESPLNPGFANRVGAATLGRGSPDFVIGGTVRPGAAFITRTAPAVGKNTGGALEVVTNPGSVRLDFFVMP
jgi:RHS repeat-associated protein